MIQRWSINGRFLTQRQTGVQRYAGEITRAIDARLAADDSLRRHMAWDLCVPTDAPAAPSFAAIEVKRSAFGRGHAWEQVVLPTMAPGGIVSFANLGPLVRRQQIVCLHDANVFLEPSSYSPTFRVAYRTIFPLLARRVRSIATVSPFSSEMLSRFGVTDRNASVIIPNGHEHALRWNAAASRFSAPDAFTRPFVFALGSRAKHKQIELLLGLAPALDALGIDLVISGGGAPIFTSAGGAGPVSAPNVLRLGFVSDDDLAALFSRALCFAFPSRTEGFGIPLLEAMVHGAPIIAADCASIPDVCGNAALYASPHDPSVWLEQIRRIAADPDLRAKLRSLGMIRYPQFSWADAAGRYIELAQSLHRTAAPRRQPLASALGRTAL